jgi:hypothetical protein
MYTVFVVTTLIVTLVLVIKRLESREAKDDGNLKDEDPNPFDF